MAALSANTSEDGWYNKDGTSWFVSILRINEKSSNILWIVICGYLKFFWPGTWVRLLKYLMMARPKDDKPRPKGLPLDKAAGKLPKTPIKKKAKAAKGKAPSKELCLPSSPIPPNSPDAPTVEIDNIIATAAEPTEEAERAKYHEIWSATQDKLLADSRKKLNGMGDTEKDMYAQFKKWLPDEACARAIYSVTEALTTADGAKAPRFGIVGSSTLAVLGDNRGIQVHPQIRPRSDLFLPVVYSNHIALLKVFIDPSDDNQYQLPSVSIYDSKPKHWGAKGWDVIMHRLGRLLGLSSYISWPHGMDANSQGDPGMLFFGRYRQPVARQQGGWECGIHTVLNAWTHAYGLAPNIKFKASSDFLKMAVEMINAACLSPISLRFIYMFLVGYGFAYEPASMSDGTDGYLALTTKPFPTTTVLDEYVMDLADARDTEHFDGLSRQATRVTEKADLDEMRAVITQLLDRTHPKLSGPDGTSALPTYDNIIVQFWRDREANLAKYPRITVRDIKERMVETKRAILMENTDMGVNADTNRGDVESSFMVWVKGLEAALEGAGDEEAEAEESDDEIAAADKSAAKKS